MPLRFNVAVHPDEPPYLRRHHAAEWMDASLVGPAYTGHIGTRTGLAAVTSARDALILTMLMGASACDARACVGACARDMCACARECRNASFIMYALVCQTQVSD